MTVSADRLSPYGRALGGALRHPRWFAETLRRKRNRRLDDRRSFSLSEHREFFATEPEAVGAVIGVPEERYRRCVASLWKPPREERVDLAALDAREELTNVLGVLVRLTRPRVVVETGVAAGFTTAVILAAMGANEHGHLYSIDFPPLRGRPELLGRAVPPGVRERWTLEIGPSRHVLPGLAQRVAPVDLFVHDSDHTYCAQLDEYRTVWPHLRPGAVLVSDDVGNPAFLEFAAEVGARPSLIVGSTDSAVGLIGKA